MASAHPQPINAAMEEEEQRSTFQEGFSWKWVWVALGINVVIEIVILAVLPKVIATYDPQGIAGLVIAAMTWGLVAWIVAMISPGKTAIEPSVAAIIIVGPTVAYLNLITPEGLNASTMSYVVTGLLGIMAALIGGLLGERGRAKPSAKRA